MQHPLLQKDTSTYRRGKHMKARKYGRATRIGSDVIDGDWLSESAGLNDIDVLADFEDNLAAEAFFRVHSVLSGRPSQQRRARPLRVGPPVQGVDARHRLWGTSAGVFLAGATEAQARQWADQQAARYGGRVLRPERHGSGRWHMHIELPNGIRSGHIFWGPPPSADFFDYDY
jgi:hypothetical protein